jgi:hypothetical protein
VSLLSSFVVAVVYVKQTSSLTHAGKLPWIPSGVSSAVGVLTSYNATLVLIAVLGIHFIKKLVFSAPAVPEYTVKPLTGAFNVIGTHEPSLDQIPHLVAEMRAVYNCMSCACLGIFLSVRPSLSLWHSMCSH